MNGTINGSFERSIVKCARIALWFACLEEKIVVFDKIDPIKFVTPDNLWNE